MLSRIRAIVYALPPLAYVTIAAIYGAAYARAGQAYAARFGALADLGDRTYAAMLASPREGAVQELDAACSGWLTTGEPESLAVYVAGRSAQGDSQLEWAAPPGTLVAANHTIGIVRELRRDVVVRGFLRAWGDMLTTWPGRWSQRVRTVNSIEPTIDNVRYLAVTSVEIALAPREAGRENFTAGEALLTVRVIDHASGNEVCEGRVLPVMPEQVRVDAGGATRIEAIGNLMTGTPSALTRAWSNSIELAPLRVLCGSVSPALCEMVTAASR